MQVCVPSTPAQVFHMLRRQAIRPLRKPLIVMSPKSLLRHPRCKSTLEELSDGYFRVVMPDPKEVAADDVTRIILCSGKVYYDLYDYREQNNVSNTVILRVEQLYPFPEAELHEMFSLYPNVQTVVWCQEEPMNQGAWYCSQHHMRHVVHRTNPALYLNYAGREGSAAPAAGYMARHTEEQNRLIDHAFNC